MGSGCGSVGRAALEFCSSDPVISNVTLMYQLYKISIERAKIRKKEAGNGPFYKSVLNLRSWVLRQ